MQSARHQIRGFFTRLNQFPPGSLRGAVVCAIWSVVSLCTHPLLSQSNTPSFLQLTVENGLSNNWVKAIAKDSEGFMWFGTFHGLNRYDGNTFRTFRTDQQNGLSDNVIECIAGDKDGFLWVGTFSGGLNRFDRKKERFTTFMHDPAKSNSLSANRVHALFADSKGTLWVGTDAGLDEYARGDESFVHYQYDSSDKTSITPGAVSAIFEDHFGNLWVGTEGGLCVQWMGENGFTRFEHSDVHPESLSQNYVKAITEDKYGNIWVGTWGGGLDMFSPDSGVFRHFRQSEGLSNNSVLGITGDQENLLYIATEGGGLNILNIQQQQISQYLPDITNDRSINSNSVHAVCFDPGNAILWAGTYNGGVNYFSKWDKPFVLYRAQINGLNNNHVTSIAEDLEGNLWIGTDGSGINILNKKTGAFSYLSTASKTSLQSDAVLSILCDRKGRVWIGSYNGGLDVLRKDGVMEHYHPVSDDPSSLSGLNVSAIYEDKQGNIWVGTMNGGLNLFDTESKSFTRFQHRTGEEASLIDNFIYGVFEDRLGRLLIQTGKGLEVYDYRTNTFSRFNADAAEQIGVPIVLHEDSQGNLWVGSQENGLFRIDRTGVKMHAYAVADGLPSNSIAGILEDAFGNLWISTQKGLCKFESAVINPDRVRFYTYAVDDGLQGSEFKRGAFCRRENRELVFGGQNGFNIFDPTRIKLNPFVPPVRFTNFRVFNKEVDFAESSLLPMPVSEVETIRLSHKQSVFTFEFAALNYLLPQRNQYAYMMDGFEEAWNLVGNQRTATYSNLDPGTYTFRVKAANNDGVWNDTGTQMQVIIVPPWWEHWLVKLAALLVLAGAVLGFFRWRTYQLKRSKRILEKRVELSTANLKKASAIIEERQKEILARNEELEQKNQELEAQTDEIRRLAEEIKELTEARSTFFANVSHELHTPLNAILAQAEELLSQHHPEYGFASDRHSVIYQNATRLVQMINQLLNLSQIEAGTVELKLAPCDALQVIRRTMSSFDEWAERKQINYTLTTEASAWHALLDAEKLDRILSNLLSNAFKAVSTYGAILVHVSISAENERLCIEVQDDGRGMSRRQLEELRSLFAQGSNTRLPGAGMGLGLVRDLVALYGGEISVDSEEDTGTTFRIVLRAKRVGADEVMPAMAKHPAKSDEAKSEKHTARSFVPSILVISDGEDNYRFRQLRAAYDIAFVQDTVSGFMQTTAQLPDLVICDAVLPDGDGQALCKALKADSRTSHIPIILMTAREGEKKLLPPEIADDVIGKPFHADLMELKIKNIFFTRQKLKEMFLKGTSPMPAPEQLSQVDEEFLRKAISVVREHMQQSEFSVEEFSEQFGMSRRNVLRKIKGITGLSINEFIRNTRLQEAYQMLLKGELNVSEVAYSVGFTDPKYFSNCFKKLFGKPPSEVRGVTNADRV